MSKKVVMTGTLGVYSEEDKKWFKEEFAKNGIDFEFLYNESTIDDDKLIAGVKGATVIIDQFQMLSEKFYDGVTPELKAYVASGIGFNAANDAVATKKGVMVANVPDYCTEEVAVHAVTLILAMQKRLPNLIKWIEDGKWGGGYTAIAPKKRFSECTVCLYGYGRIPRMVAKMLLSFGVKVMAFDAFVPDEAMKETGVVPVDFDTMCKEADYLSIHVPALPGTIGKINKDAFKMMKKNAVLINTGRGAVCNADDLYEALTTGMIDSAAIDAYETEPPTGVEEKIKLLPNVLSTPHIAYYSDTAIMDLKQKLVQECTRICNGEVAKNLVNKKVLEIIGK